MPERDIPTLGDPDVCKEAERLKAPIRDQYRTELGYDRVDTLSIFKAFGLKEVAYSDLSAEIKEAIIQGLKKSQRSTDGVPQRHILREEGAWPAAYKLVSNDDHSTIYFFMDFPDRNRFGHIACTRFRDWGDGYEVTPVNHDSYTKDLVHALSLYEAQVNISNIRAQVSQAVS